MNRTKVGLFGLSIVLAGCGGGGGGVSTPPVTETPVAEKGTAFFDVDVASGKVKVVPLEAGKGKSAVLGGSAVTFTTSTLLSEGGEVGRRVIKAQLRNNLNEAIGVGRPVRIQFGVIGPATNYLSDLRANATVSSPIRVAGGGGFVDGPVVSANISFPNSVAVGQDGAIYFNGTDNRIRRLLDGYVSTVAQNVPATGLVYLRDPVTGREYLVAPCSSLHSVKLVPIASGSVSTWAGLDSTSGNVNGAASTARFTSPVGAAVDSGSNQVLIGDSGNGAVRAIPYTFSGGNLAAGTVLTRYSGLTNPTYVAVSSNRSVGVLESAVHRLRIFNAGSSKEAILGGTSGNVNGDGNVAQFNFPNGITSIGDTFFVSDTNNNQVKRIALKNGAAPLLAANWTVGVVAGAGGSGYGEGPGSTALFGNIINMATDSNGRLLAADAGANGIRRIVTNGSFDFGTPDGSGIGQASLANQTGYADLNGLNRPYIDVPGPIQPGMTAEAGEWQFVIPSGVTAFRFAVTVEAGTSAFAPLEAVLNSGAGPGSPNVYGQWLSRGGIHAPLTGPLSRVAFPSTSSNLVIDAQGVIYMVDNGLRVIRRIDPNGNVTLVAGIENVSGNVNGAGSVATFESPSGLTVNPEGTELFICDYSSSLIRRIALIYQYADPTLAENWNVTTVAGLVSTPGDVDGPGDAARVNAPIAAVVDGDSVYFTEFTHRVRALRYRGGPRGVNTSYVVESIAGGQSGYQDGAASSALFSQPWGIALSPEGNLYIADTNNRRIRMIDLKSNTVTTVAGNGVTGGIDSNSALSATFSGLVNVSCDAAGTVYISESTAIRRLQNGAVKTVAGRGNGSGTSGDKIILSGSKGFLSMPNGDLLVTANGQLVRLTRVLGR